MLGRRRTVSVAGVAAQESASPMRASAEAGENLKGMPSTLSRPRVRVWLSPGTGAVVTLPSDRDLLPVGWYMLFEMVDDKPGPDREIEARSEINALKQVIRELPARRREMFMATFVNEVPLRETAERFGVSVRTVQVELKQALVHCAARLDRGTHRPRPTRPAHSLYRNGHAHPLSSWSDALRRDGRQRAAAPDEP